MKLGNRLKTRNERTNPTLAMAMTLVVMYAISGVLLLLLAALLYKFELSEATVKIGIIAIYLLTGVGGGLLIGKKMQDKKYLWGLSAGILYGVLLIVLSLFMALGSGTEVSVEPVRILSTLLLCTMSGMVGGMLS